MTRFAHIAIAVALASAPAAALACDPSTPSGLAACVDRDRYAADLTALAQAPRTPGSPALEAARQRCLDTFAKAGFGVRRHAPGEHPEHMKWHPDGDAVAEAMAERGIVNVIGRKKGSDPGRPAVLVGAHMDSVRGCNGANDNASGVAAVLEMARVLGRAANRADLYVACFDAEETGKLGSMGWVSMARHGERALDAALIFEQIGNRQTAPGTQGTPPPWFEGAFPEATQAMKAGALRGDFAQFIWDSGVTMNVWDAMVSAGGVRMLRGVLPRRPDGSIRLPHPGLGLSDHAQFWEQGYPAVYITDTGPFRAGGFHCKERPDDARFIDLDFAAGVTRAATVFAADRLGIGGP